MDTCQKKQQNVEVRNKKGSPTTTNFEVDWKSKFALQDGAITLFARPAVRRRESGNLYNALFYLFNAISASLDRFLKY